MGFGLRMPKLKMKSEIIWRETVPGAVGRVLVPYGKPTLKRNRPSLAVLMVLGGGGGGGKRDSVWIRT